MKKKENLVHAGWGKAKVWGGGGGGVHTSAEPPLLDLNLPIIPEGKLKNFGYFLRLFFLDRKF